MTLTGPDPDTIYPIKDDSKLVFLKNFVKGENITVGDYTYFLDIDRLEAAGLEES